MYPADRPKKGGGVAIYVKSKFKAIVSESISKQLGFLELIVELVKGLCISVVGCYRPLSALNVALPSLVHLLSRLDYTEII